MRLFVRPQNINDSNNRGDQRKERGISTLEFGLVMTLILFPLMFGIIDFSRAVYAYHWVSYAAREGTRWASVRGAACPTLNPLPGGCPATAAQIQTFVQSIHPPGMAYVAGSCATPGCVSVDTTTSFMWPGLGGDGTDCTNGGVLGPNSPGCIVKVQVNYYFGFSLPFLEKVTGTTVNMQSTSQMVISQ
jgi:TadE-like protein